MTKTTRTGSFLASEPNPASYLGFFSVIFLSHRQAAVFLHPPEMNGDQHNRDQRQDDAVKNVETQQGVLADHVAAERFEAHPFADDRHGRDDVGPHGDGPERQLVPGKQVAGVAQEQRDDAAARRRPPS